MGYCIDLKDGIIKIKEENKIKAIEFLKAYVVEDRVRWVDKDEVTDAKTFEDVMYSYRYTMISNNKDEKTNIETYTVCFDGEKLGDETDFMPGLFDLFEDESIISFIGEDGDMFGWETIQGKSADCNFKVIKTLDSYRFDRILDVYRASVKTRDEIEIANIEAFLKDLLCQ